MANELRAAVKLIFSKANSTARTSPLLESLRYFDVTGETAISGRMSVGTSAETIPKGDIGTIGAVALWNHDTTNYIEAGDDADSPSIKLYPDGSGLNFCLVPWGATDVSVKAATSACEMDYILVEV